MDKHRTRHEIAEEVHNNYRKLNILEEICLIGESLSYLKSITCSLSVPIGVTETSLAGHVEIAKAKHALRMDLLRLKAELRALEEINEIMVREGLMQKEIDDIDDSDER